MGAAESNAFGALLKAQLAQLAVAAGLTSRENEVLDLPVLGRNASEIGKVLGISARTAKFHQARLLSKLGADSRIDLIRLLLCAAAPSFAPARRDGERDRNKLARRVFREGRAPE